MALDSVRALAAIDEQAAASPVTLGQPMVLRDLVTGRSVVLEGDALPERGLRGGVRLRANITRYPGSSKGSTQVMGTEDDDLEMGGWWRDTLLHTAGGARSFVAAFDALLRGQNLVELTWGDAVVVRGFVREFTPEWDTEADVRWRARFMVVDSEADQVVSRPTPETPTAATMSTVLEFLRGAQDEIAAAVAVSNAAQAVLA